MRPKMKSTRNEILFHHEKNSVYITCHCGQNEIKIYFRVGRSQTTHQKIKTNHKWEILEYGTLLDMGTRESMTISLFFQLCQALSQLHLHYWFSFRITHYPYSSVKQKIRNVS